jgi:hypothetical protein
MSGRRREQTSRLWEGLILPESCNFSVGMNSNRASESIGTENNEIIYVSYNKDGNE